MPVRAPTARVAGRRTRSFGLAISTFTSADHCCGVMLLVSNVVAAFGRSFGPAPLTDVALQSKRFDISEARTPSGQTARGEGAMP
jgi:hypothetical protein